MDTLTKAGGIEFRAGHTDDLFGLYALYDELIAYMHNHGNSIWNEVYPAMCFESDIRAGLLYVLTVNGELASSIAFSSAPCGEENVAWSSADNEAVYLSRLGVRPCLQGRGLAVLMLRNMARNSMQRGYKTLRCYAVDTNIGAIRLYERLGFTRVRGFRPEPLPDRVLIEYGYEISAERLMGKGERTEQCGTILQ